MKLLTLNSHSLLEEDYLKKNTDFCRRNSSRKY